MRISTRLFAATFAMALLPVSTLVRAQDDAKPAAKTDKPAEKAPPSEVTTQGTIDAGGQHIAYSAIAGTLTVGATDVQDAQLGIDGKPEPGSQLALSEPKEPKDSSPVARMFYVAYFKRTQRPRTGPSHSFTTAARAAQPSGCIWARWGRSMW